MTSESFTESETATLLRYFTNVDKPVFALRNLPEVVKGALFARYSRTHKSLRRLFLDEFAQDFTNVENIAEDKSASSRAEKLYSKVLVEYGDDSVAQLGGAHLACEQVSILLSKTIERGRLMAYLEQSTRYLNYSRKRGEHYRYIRTPEIMSSPYASIYTTSMDNIFHTYSQLVENIKPYIRSRYPKQHSDSDSVYRQAVNAKAYDSFRSLLPSGTSTNLGIYGNGQSYEYLILRLRAHPLPEAKRYAELMLGELRKAIPSFLKRIDMPDRGGAWTDYMTETHSRMRTAAEKVMPIEDTDRTRAPSVRLIGYDPEGETELLAAALFEHSTLPDEGLKSIIDDLCHSDRVSILREYVGNRRNRRHRPGRAFEMPTYRFEIVCDYGAFRDLQRHRMLSIEWQALGCEHGYEIPENVEEAGFSGEYQISMENSAGLYDTLRQDFPEEASYAVLLGYKIRFQIKMNAREAMHMLELRTMKSGHENYRKIAHLMFQQIDAVAGHKAIAESMRFVGRDDDKGLERLDSERVAEKKRAELN